MNKLLTEFEGGFPVTLDDFRFIDSAYRTAIERLCKGLFGTAETYIIEGCEVELVGNVYNVSAGAVLIDGEICEVAAQSLIKDPAQTNVKWLKEISLSTATKTMANNTIVQPYELRSAILINYTPEE